MSKVVYPKEPPQPITVHFNGGTKATTLLTDEDLEDAGVDTYEQLVENAVSKAGRPHWCWVGDIHFFTGACSGIELADTTA